MRMGWIVGLASVLAVAAGVPSARALNIHVHYDDVTSIEPPADPDGTRLMAVFNAAGDHWESIISDPVEIDVFISWRSTLASNVLASALVFDHNDDGRPISGRVHFNRDIDFYLDPTPTDDDEYAMAPQFYGDLAPADQSAWYNGSPPPLLEGAYAGWALGTAPAEAQNFTDLFSVAIHELGHILGMNGQTAWLQLLDTDYDFNPSHIGGATAAVVNNPVNGQHHLFMPDALMSPGIGSGARVRPSATDIFAIASTPVIPWTVNRMPRTEFLGGVNLNAPAAWIGGKLPTVGNDAFVRVSTGSPPMASTTGNMVFGNLEVLEGSWITTNHTMAVTYTTTIDAALVAPGGTSRVRVQPAGGLTTDDLVIGPDAVLHLLGGYVGVDDDAEVTPHGVIQGEGMMFVQGRMTNDGLIRADGVKLTLSTWGGGTVWDLDGAGGGALEVIDGDMFIYGGHVGSFNGTLTVGAGRKLEVAHPWWFGDNSTVTLAGGPTGAATVHSADTRFRGMVIIDRAIVEGRTTFQAPAIVTAGGASDVLELHDQVVFDGGTYIGAGTIMQLGDIDVVSDTKIDVHHYDWGNSSIFQVNQTVISPGVTFHVNSSNVTTPGNPYHGDMLVSGGTLRVTPQSFWTLPAPTGGPMPRSGGTLKLAESGGHPARVQGEPLMLHHKIDAITGTGIIEADLRTSPTAEIQVRNGADLQLAGSTTFNGGNIHGDGELGQWGDITVAGETTIDTAVFAWGNSIGTTTHTLTVAPGVRFNVNSPTTGDVSNTFRGAINVDSGVLAVNTLTPWTLPAANGPTMPPGVLTLTRGGTEKPSVTGIATMVVAGELNIDADEAFFESRMILRTGKVTFLADGEMQHVAPLKLEDGTFDHAQRTGWLRTSPSTSLEWDGGANIAVEGDQGGSLTFDLAGGTTVVVPAITPTLTIEPGATVNLVGGTDPFTDSVNPTQHVNVVNNSTSSFNVVAGAKAIGTLGGVGNTSIASGATLTAASVNQNDVSIAAGGTLVVTGDVDVRRGGTLSVDGALKASAVNIMDGSLTSSGGGTITIDGNVTLADGGTLYVEYNSAGLAGLASTSTVALGDDSALSIRLAGDAGPRLGETMTLITAARSLTGIFGHVDGVLFGEAGDNRAFAVTYQAGDARATMTVALPGDFEVDGDVDFADFTYLAASYGQRGKSWVNGDCDGDGVVGFPDFTYLAANYGRDGDSPADSPAEAPSTGAVELHVDVITGEMRLAGNAATLSGYSITSAGDNLVPDGDGDAAPFQLYLANLADDISAASVGVGVPVDGEFPLDAAYDTAGAMDLTFSYGVFGQGGSVGGQVIAVPEPTCLALLALGGLAVLRRRHR